jgi:hypothetical protein
VLERACRLFGFTHLAHEKGDLLAMAQRPARDLLQDCERLAHTIVNPEAVKVTAVAAPAKARRAEPAGMTAPASSGLTYDSPGAKGLAEIKVVAAPSAPPVVMPALIVVALAVELQKTARPIFAVVCVGAEYTVASAFASCIGATSWSWVTVVIGNPSSRQKDRDGRAGVGNLDLI